MTSQWFVGSWVPRFVGLNLRAGYRCVSTLLHADGLAQVTFCMFPVLGLTAVRDALGCSQKGSITFSILSMEGV
jgi:hypothetical protein